jgi:hypothetical protein
MRPGPSETPSLATSRLSLPPGESQSLAVIDNYAPNFSLVEWYRGRGANFRDVSANDRNVIESSSVHQEH